MIGNEDDALTALMSYDEGDRTFIFSRDGSSRIVYLIDGIIYKVNLDDSYDFNEREFNTAARLRDNLPDNVRIPEMSIYRFRNESVLACEYISGIRTGECFDKFVGMDCECPEKECLPDNLATSLRNAGWDDTCYGNAIWSDDILYLVDVA